MKVRIENNLTNKMQVVEAKSVMSCLSPPATLVEFLDPGNPEASGLVWFSDECDTLAGTYATYTLIR